MAAWESGGLKYPYSDQPMDEGEDDEGEGESRNWQPARETSSQQDTCDPVYKIGRSMTRRRTTPRRRAERSVGARISMVSVETTKRPCRSDTLTFVLMGLPAFIVLLNRV